MANLALQISGYQNPSVAGVLLAGAVGSWTWWAISHETLLAWTRKRKKVSLWLSIVIGALIGAGTGLAWWLWQVKPHNPIATVTSQPNTQSPDLSLPLVVEFHVSNGSGGGDIQGERRFLTITTGLVGISDIKIEGVKYIFDLEAWRQRKLKLESFSMLGLLKTIPDIQPRNASEQINVGDLRGVRLYTVAEHISTPDDLPERTNYCFRISFEDARTLQRYAVYKVVSGLTVATFFEEGVLPGGNAQGQPFVMDIPDVIKTDARTRFVASALPEYR
jgi:hypothetical protein